MIRGHMNSAEIDHIVNKVIDDPDGYWTFNPDSDKPLIGHSITPNDAIELRQEFVRRRRLKETGKQFREVALLPPESLESKISRATLSLTIPLASLFIALHDEKNHGLSWREINEDLCRQLETKLNILAEEFQNTPLYAVVFLQLITAIDAKTITQHRAISNTLRLLSAEMFKQHLPILLVTLDDYLSKKPEMDTLNHLEPDIKVIQPDDAQQHILQAIQQEVERLSGKTFDSEFILIIGKLLVSGGWMTASKSSGDNLLEKISVLLPELFKYTQSVLETAQKFGILMTNDDVVRCMMRLYGGHEASHGLHGHLEFQADRVAVPAALSLALQSGEEEYRKQVVFVIADMCRNMSPYGVFTKEYRQPEKEYEHGYVISGCITLHALTQTGVATQHDGLWSISSQHHNELVKVLLETDPEITLQKTMMIAEENPEVKKLYALAMETLSTNQRVQLSIELFQKSEGYCGPTALQTILAYYGMHQSEEEVAQLIGATHENGCDPIDIIEGAKKAGFEVEYKQHSDLQELKKLVQNGTPVIVQWYSPEEGGQYSVLFGYENNVLFITNPFTGHVRKINEVEFIERWYEINEGELGEPTTKTIKESFVIRKFTKRID